MFEAELACNTSLIEKVSDVALGEISKLASRQLKLEADVVVMTDALKEKVKQLKYVQEVLLPAAMDGISMSGFTLDDGTSVKIKRSYSASISVENFPAAKKWLVDNDMDGIIKTQVLLNFGKGEIDKANEAVTLLTDGGLHPEIKETIHPQTLKAFVNEVLGKGEDLPEETFGLFPVVKAVVVK